MTSLLSNIYENISKSKLKFNFSNLKEFQKSLNNVQNRNITLAFIIITGLVLTESGVMYVYSNQSWKTSEEPVPFDHLSAYDWINTNLQGTQTRFAEVPPDGSRKLDMPMYFDYYVGKNQLLGTGMEYATHVYKYAYQLVNLLNYNLYNGSNYDSNYTLQLLSMFDVQYIIANAPNFLNMTNLHSFGTDGSIFNFNYSSYVVVANNLVYHNPDDYLMYVPLENQTAPLGTSIYDSNPFASTNNATFETLNMYNYNYSSHIASVIPVRDHQSTSYANNSILQYSIKNLKITSDMTSFTITTNQHSYIQLSQGYVPSLKISVDDQNVKFMESSLNLVILELPAGTHNVIVTGGLSDFRLTLIVLNLPLLIFVIAILVLTYKKRINK